MPGIVAILWETLVTCSQFCILGRDLLKKNKLKTTQILSLPGKQDLSSTDVPGPECTQRHSRGGGASEEASGDHTAVIGRE